MNSTFAAVKSADGTTIAYDCVGEGKPLILVGGAFQYRAFDERTARLAELLSGQFTVYHYDRRGRGDSGDTLPYAKEREIEDLAALMKEAGGSASVFGMSSGSFIALDAIAAGLNIEKLAIYEAPVLVDDSRAPVRSDYLETLNRLSSENNREEMVEFFLVEGAGVPKEYLGSMKESPLWSGFIAVAPTLAYDAAFAEGTANGRSLPDERVRQWASVTVPTLVLAGGASAESWHNGAKAIAEALPDARLEFIPEQQHDVDPSLLAPKLKEFFSA